MAQYDIDVIYKSLRLLPDFDGNSHVLTRFIKLCDQLVLRHYCTTPGNELSNLALINGILNKVTGPAARHINANGIPENWQGIRSALINNFADHRDESSLYNDLAMQTQGSSTPQEYYERCQNLFSTIMTYVSLHETVPSTIEAKRTLYQNLTLKAYLRGLKDPLGSRIRCMRPESMEKALEFVQEELNTVYMQTRNEAGPSHKKDWSLSQSNSYNLPLNNFVPKQPLYAMPSTSRPMMPSSFNPPGPSRQQPMQPPTQGWRPNHIRVQQPQGPTRTQQMMRAPLPNYNPGSHVFRLPNRPPPQQSFGAPRPMSGVSHFVPKPLPPTGRDWRVHGNPPPSNYFQTREVNMNEFDYDYDYNSYDYGDYEPDFTYPNEQYGYYDNSDYAYYGHPLCPYNEHPTVDKGDLESNVVPAENFQQTSQSEKPK